MLNKIVIHSRYKQFGPNKNQYQPIINKLFIPNRANYICDIGKSLKPIIKSDNFYIWSFVI